MRMLTGALFRQFLLCWMGMAVCVFFVLLRIPAPYGRTVRRGWGPVINSRIGWMLMEGVAAAVFLLMFLMSGSNWNGVLIVFALLWELHYINRCFIFPLRSKSAQKRMPISVITMALLFNAINGWINGTWLFVLSPAYAPSWFLDVRFLSGLVLFTGGFSINVAADTLLRRQRMRQNGSYVMPKGFLFRWISCPNYFGEVIEWCGWALLTWSLAGLSFSIWTCANLIPRALTYHRWYKEHFPDYPLSRKAIIPFVL